MTRHPAIKSSLELLQHDKSYYRGSPELLSSGAALSQAFDFTRIGIHYELLPPGRRTSWPHAESTEDEFVFVIEGQPEVWLDGHLYPLNPGDAVGFKAGDGLAHTFLNNTEHPVRLLVVGDRSRADNKIHYPLHPLRNVEVGNAHWDEMDRTKNPDRPPLGPHDGLPDLWRRQLGEGPVLRVRPLQENDFESILTYWSKAHEQDLARMGCDQKKFSSEEARRAALFNELKQRDSEKTVSHLIWEVAGKSIGYSNLKRLKFGESADIHLHMWDQEARGKGYGGKLFEATLQEFFRRFKLKNIFCEPSSANPYPNRMLQKMGFPVAKTYVTTPSELALEGEVNRYEINADEFLSPYPFQIRFAKIEDVEMIAPLIAALGNGSQDEAGIKARLHRVLSMRGIGVLVADHPLHGVQGYLSYSVKPQLRFANLQLAVDELAMNEVFRGKNIDSQLLAQAKSIAASLHCEPIIVPSSI